MRRRYSVRGYDFDDGYEDGKRASREYYQKKVKKLKDEIKELKTRLNANNGASSTYYMSSGITTATVTGVTGI
ncbi:hypothetical protein LCGC14_2997190 [marine sediment metagenome]|uniref:Uncharacterized protein n=1 Tax=marine sediment metagenome TaxID=412755 RepID=A0A0F8X2K1_9ZZZZ